MLRSWFEFGVLLPSCPAHALETSGRVLVIFSSYEVSRLGSLISLLTLIPSNIYFFSFLVRRVSLSLFFFEVNCLFLLALLIILRREISSLILPLFFVHTEGFVALLEVLSDKLDCRDISCSVLKLLFWVSGSCVLATVQNSCFGFLIAEFLATFWNSYFGFLLGCFPRLFSCIVDETFLVKACEHRKKMTKMSPLLGRAF